MPTCSFSGEKMEPGTGKMYVKKDGSVLYFKNSKCEKNYLKLGRKPLATKWTRFYRDEQAKHKKSESTKK